MIQKYYQRKYWTKSYSPWTTSHQIALIRNWSKWKSGSKGCICIGLWTTWWTKVSIQSWTTTNSTYSFSMEWVALSLSSLSSASAYKVTSPQSQGLMQPVSQPHSSILQPCLPSPAHLDSAHTLPGPPPPLLLPDVKLLYNQNLNTSFSRPISSHPSVLGIKKVRTPLNVNASCVMDVKEVKMVEVEVGEVENEKLPTGMPFMVAPSTSTVAPTTTMATSAKKSTKNRKHMCTLVKQTWEQEKLVYECVFIGCGKDNYNMMMKLGGGILGCILITHTWCMDSVDSS